MLKRFSLAMVVLGLFSSTTQASAMRLWFQVEAAEQGVLITPFIEGDRPILRYELESAKQSSAGLSSIRQGGFIFPSPDEARAITQLRLGGPQEGSCSVTLRIYQDQQLLAEKTLTDCRPVL